MGEREVEAVAFFDQIGVDADHLTIRLAGAVDDVIVGDDEAAVVENDATTATGRLRGAIGEHKNFDHAGHCGLDRAFYVPGERHRLGEDHRQTRHSNSGERISLKEVLVNMSLSPF